MMTWQKNETGYLELKLVFHKGNGKGKMRNEYYSDDELERMFEMITSVQKGE